VHPEAFDFVCRAANLIPTPHTVLEIGSRNVNGSAKDAFDLGLTSWVGIDKTAGGDVDIVDDFVTMKTGPLNVDLVVCCEVLEHEADVYRMVTRLIEAAKPGGHVLITCATYGRAEHSAVDGGALKGDEHYRNVEPGEVVRSDVTPLLLENHPNRGDLYALLQRR
jgi:hypothetical protein